VVLHATCHDCENGRGRAAEDALKIARSALEAYAGCQRLLLERLTFVREDDLNCWLDLAQVLLGRSLVSR